MQVQGIKRGKSFKKDSVTEIDRVHSPAAVELRRSTSFVRLVYVYDSSDPHAAVQISHSQHACVSADLDPSRFWIPYDVTHCLGMRSSLKCRKVTYKMCVAHPRKWIRFLLAGTVLADLDGQKLRFCERRLNLRG